MEEQNIKCAFTTLGLIIGEFEQSSTNGSYTIKNPRTIAPSQDGAGVGLTNFMVMFEDAELTLKLDDVVSNPLTPKPDLLKFYLREFSQGVELIVPDKKIITA